MQVQVFTGSNITVKLMLLSNLHGASIALYEATKPEGIPFEDTSEIEAILKRLEGYINEFKSID